MRHLLTVVGLGLMVAVMVPGVSLVQWATKKQPALGLAAFLGVVGAEIGVVFAFAWMVT